MEIWQQLVVLIFTPTAAVAAVAYLIRCSFDRALDRDLERYKSDLQLERFEYQTKYSLIHQRRAEIISEFYGLLVRAVDAATDLVRVLRFNDIQPLPDQKNRAQQCHNEMKQFFREHRLYFDEGLCERIQELLRLEREALIQFHVAQPGSTIEQGSSTDEEMWIAADDKIRNQVGAIKEELERQFRSLLEAKPER